MYTAVSDQNTLTVIDSVAGLEPLLQAIAEKKDRGSTILKVNAAELCRMAGVKKTNSEAGGVEPDELVQGVKQFLAKFRPGAVLALNAIAVTDGAHPAYMATLPVTEEENEFRLFRLQVAQLKQEETQKNKSSWASSSSIDAETSSRTLYPIGAGDAVAAGTLAAWKCLTDGPTATESVLPEEIRSVLAGNETPVSRAMLTSFAFGLACGSASCLQEENSVLKIEDAKNLFLAAGRPSFLSSHMII
jgi:fructose-1-phosphate kinase PfkB-like protein